MPKNSSKQTVRNVIQNICTDLNVIPNVCADLFEFMKKNSENRNWDRIKGQFRFLGNNVTIPAPYLIKNPQYISIGNNFGSLHNLRLEAWDYYCGERFHPNIEIGDNVLFNSDCHIGCIGSIVIEEGVLCGSRILVTDHLHGNPEYTDLSAAPKDRKLSFKGPVIIKRNTLIGEGVAILPNVTIGENCIIGANSVVTKDVPDNSVAAGVPLRVIKVIKNATGFKHELG